MCAKSLVAHWQTVLALSVLGGVTSCTDRILPTEAEQFEATQATLFQRSALKNNIPCDNEAAVATNTRVGELQLEVCEAGDYVAREVVGSTVIPNYSFSEYSEGDACNNIFNFTLRTFADEHPCADENPAVLQKNWTYRITVACCEANALYARWLNGSGSEDITAVHLGESFMDYDDSPGDAGAFLGSATAPAVATASVTSVESTYANATMLSGAHEGGSCTIQFDTFENELYADTLPDEGNVIVATFQNVSSPCDLELIDYEDAATIVGLWVDDSNKIRDDAHGVGSNVLDFSHSADPAPTEYVLMEVIGRATATNQTKVFSWQEVEVDDLLLGTIPFQPANRFQTGGNSYSMVAVGGIDLPSPIPSLEVLAYGTVSGSSFYIEGWTYLH